MNTFLNFQQDLEAMTEKEIEVRMQGIRRLPINQRIMLRGEYEQWCVLMLPNYHPDQLKRKIKGNSTKSIRNRMLQIR